MNDADGNPENAASKAASMWFDFLGRMTATGFPTSAETPPPAAARQMRDVFLKAMSAQAEEYMRSPEFLEMMKGSMDSALAWRSQLNEFLRRAYRESRIPSQDDIEDFAGRVQQLSKQVLQRLESIEQQLAIVLERLNSKSGPAKAPQPAKKTSRLGSGLSSVKQKTWKHKNAKTQKRKNGK